PGTVTVPSSVRRCMTTWLPRRRTSVKPWDSSILQTSRPERRRSLAMLGFESRHVDFGVQAPFDFGGISTFQEQSNRLFQVSRSFLDRCTLAGHVELRAKSHVQIAFFFDDRRVAIGGHR